MSATTSERICEDQRAIGYAVVTFEARHLRPGIFDREFCDRSSPPYLLAKHESLEDSANFPEYRGFQIFYDFGGDDVGRLIRHDCN